ncbi:hypothetical protein [Streptomyces sp. NPDC002082]|uniref:hypothetical protein n=1 Tax=Streptomyces sp. NPDC002082 TaxID=3154772 RepID=UPI00332D6607
MSRWPSIVAVLGTLAGALTAGLLQHRSARTARAEEHTESHRQNQLGAVTAFAAALDAHRSAIFHRERLALAEAGTEHHLEAPTRSHDTRAAITAPHIHLQILVPTLAVPAQQASDATYALRKTTDRPELDAQRHAACGMRHAACGMRHAACGMRHAACGMRHAACGKGSIHRLHQCGRHTAEPQPSLAGGDPTPTPWPSGLPVPCALQLVCPRRAFLPIADIADVGEREAFLDSADNRSWK